MPGEIYRASDSEREREKREREKRRGKNRGGGGERGRESATLSTLTRSRAVTARKPETTFPLCLTTSNKETIE